MLHIVLFQPEIPQNTGNIGRLCAYTGSRLHLIHPLGFTISDRHLKRSGMDYWERLDVHHHADWQAFQASPLAPPGRLWLLSTRGTATIWETFFSDGDGLVFGNEGQGAPDWLHEALRDTRIMIPRFAEGLRSLNLATAVGVSTYEALRQIRG
ncbi:MAG: tRNA (cytidine(34)-2'-O)-methyltransferase [Opitutales bacterium]